MEKPQTIRGLLGLTQKELAMILNVDRTQIVKYEAGSRDLPRKAKHVLAEILLDVQSTDLASKSTPHEEIQKEKILRQLQRLARDNEYKLLVATKELAIAEETYQASMNALHTIDFLSNRSSFELPEQLLKIISKRATAAIEKSGKDELIRLQVRKEVLKYENLYIDYRIQKIASEAENKDSENNFK